ncbi:MAG: hypothetical protein ACIAXF_14155 [Phycisphaerales bacterium JB063]
MDGKRIGYKGNVFVQVPDGMTISHAENLLAADGVPAPLPDKLREAAERLGNCLDHGVRPIEGQGRADLRTILDHLQESSDD